MKFERNPFAFVFLSGEHASRHVANLFVVVAELLLSIS
jgi:hypothetical protein